MRGLKTFAARTGAAMLLSTMVFATMPAVHAQDASGQDGAEQEAIGQATPDGALDIPKSVTLFEQRNPNIRRATAIINGSVITETDVDQRLALVVLANGDKISDEERQRLRLQVLRNLIDETLEIQEAKAKDITVSPQEIDQNFDRVANNIHKTPEEFSKYLADHGSSAASIKRQIQGEVAWNSLLRREVQPFINVSADEVNAVVKRLEASKGKEEYRIGEIYLSATPENKQQVFQNAQQILDQVRKGGSFVAYARQYSEASTAAVGGDLGWVRLPQLPEALADAAGQMNVGQVVGPVAVPGGFSILYLKDKRQILTTDPRDAILNLKQMSIAFPPGTTNAQAQAKAKTFGDETKTMHGCGDVDALAPKVGATVVENAGIKARDLPAQLQSILLKMQVGEATPPFGSVKDGVRVLVLCGRDDPEETNKPSFDKIMSQMEEKRVNKRAQIYLRDLRRDAVIDYN